MNKENQDLLKAAIDEIKALNDIFLSIGNMEDKIFEKELAQRLNRIDEMSELMLGSKRELMKLCYRMAGKELDSSVILKHAREKPYGYPGDFQLIDWIYNNKPLSQGKGRLWDEMFLRQPAAQAVRNRVDFFERQLSMCCNSRGTSVLSLASGPCREVLGAIRTLAPSNGFAFHFVDQDERAITYARSLFNGIFSHLKLQWEVNNVFKYHPQQKYSLIWVSGLFDYLDDRLASIFIRRMWRWLDGGGRIIIGNFHPSNPNRNQMEWCLGWFLIHRTEEQLLKLCAGAGIPAKSISVVKEPLGMNIFAVIDKVRMQHLEGEKDG